MIEKENCISDYFRNRIYKLEKENSILIQNIEIYKSLNDDICSIFQRLNIIENRLNQDSSGRVLDFKISEGYKN